MQMQTIAEKRLGSGRQDFGATTTAKKIRYSVRSSTGF